jgi:hypothetical protein
LSAGDGGQQDADGHSPRTGIARAAAAVTGTRAMMAAAARAPSSCQSELKSFVKEPEGLELDFARFVLDHAL